MDDTQTEKSHLAKPPSAVEKTISALKYPIVAASGIIFGHRYARNALYDTLKNRKVFKDHEEALDTAVSDAVKEAVATSGSLKGKIRPLSKNYNKAVTDFLKEKGFKNTIDYIAELHPNQQFDTALAAFSAASITLGVILTMTQNKSLFDNFMNASDKKADVGR
jgi:hypothetical protein